MPQKERWTMRGERGVLPTVGRSIVAACAAACVALVLLAAGCGSSESSGTNSTGSNSTTTSSASAKTAAKTAASGGLKAVTTPKYAVPSSSEPVKSGVVQIAYRNIAIDPDTVRAKAGSTIKWTNEDPEKCNVKSEGGPYTFASKDFGEGASFELKLDKPGLIHYECTYYPTTMNGTIEVVG
jgi:plastocyanin